jgi:hypothetical protein
MSDLLALPSRLLLLLLFFVEVVLCVSIAHVQQPFSVHVSLHFIKF